MNEHVNQSVSGFVLTLETETWFGVDVLQLGSRFAN
jgi:hypothetical protein